MLSKVKTHTRKTSAPFCPPPLYVSEAWEVSTPGPAKIKILESLDSTEVKRRDRWWAEGPIAFRSVRLPFYKDVLLVEFKLRRSFGDGFLIGSYLAAKRQPAAPKERGKKLPAKGEYDIFALNGMTSPIHEVNRRFTVILDTSEQAVAYLKFFCAFTWADGGGFWICEEATQLPWLPVAKREGIAQVAHLIAPVRYLSHTNRVSRIEACVLYSKHLFVSKFAIATTGIIDMTEEKPLLEPAIEVFEDRRLKGFRALPLSAV